MIASNINESTLHEAAARVGVSITTSATSSTGRRHKVKVSPGDVPKKCLTKGGYRKKGEEGDNEYQRISYNMNGGERRVAAVCWHGFRDFFRACFEIEPDAKFYTAMDTWDGSEDFEERFAASGHKNMGSQFMPVYAADACRCDDRGYAG